MFSAAIKTDNVSSAANYIESVFSTYLYTGNGSTQTITNGIDLSTYGGLVWIKQRSVGNAHALYDTARGVRKAISSNFTLAELTAAAGKELTAFNTTGFSLGTDDNYTVNANATTFASWTFRKQAKFFDVVTYTGTGSAQNIAHNLGSVPGCIIVKRLNSTGNWFVYHRSLGNGNVAQLNTTAAAFSANTWNYTTPTSTQFTVSGTGDAGLNGATYVAYLFAHDAGGFGLTGSDNVISCGSFTTNGSGVATVNLGYEPQWLLVKANAAANDWYVYDTMRGFNYSNYVYLSPNLSSAEGNIAADYLVPTSTGFNTKSFAASTTYIYIAIRRGPMKVPTSGTSVFEDFVGTGASGGALLSTNFNVDLIIDRPSRPYADSIYVFDRLRGTSSSARNYLQTNSTAAENTSSSATYYIGIDYSNAYKDIWAASDINGPYSYVSYAFGRAPSFFDVVCYTGTGVARTVTHNLAAVPELMIVKRRDVAGSGWPVYSAALGAAKYLVLQGTDAEITGSTIWNNTAPTSSVFTVGTASAVNASGGTYVAYLFATCTGVSKVGSYTGTGALQTINCGFAAGARYVLIKRTDSTGGWYFWDSARGISSGNDPYLLLNATAAEVTGTNYVDTTSVGFQVTAAAPADLNANGGTYIFLAVA